MSRSGMLTTTSSRRKGSISFTIDPRRSVTDKVHRFTACVWIGGKSRRGYSSTSCMNGSNPRRALAAALRSLAKSKLGSRRKGAFKGMRRKGRR